MRSLTKGVWIVGLLAVVAVTATPKPSPAPEDELSSIVIVLKDGRQESFRLVDIARIEFKLPTRRTLAAGRARFLGQWKVGDGAGGTFLITLKPDGVAHKTIGSSKEGTWAVVDGEVRISWNDGWHDVIRKADGKYQKVAFSPGTSFSGQPANVTEAVYTEAQ